MKNRLNEMCSDEVNEWLDTLEFQAEEARDKLKDFIQKNKVSGSKFIDYREKELRANLGEIGYKDLIMLKAELDGQRQMKERQKEKKERRKGQNAKEKHDTLDYTHK